MSPARFASLVPIDRIRGAVMHEEIAPDRGVDIDTYFPISKEQSILDGV